MSDVTTRPPRRTQQERREATQRRVLDAAIECLVEFGYGGLSTVRVADRAGVSRGAAAQQYPSRERLVVAAVEHLFARRAEELRAVADRLPGNADRTAAAIGLLWTQFSSPLFPAALELWVAARTDPSLREALLPFERNLRRVTRQLMGDLFGPPANEHPDFPEVVSLVFNTLHGAAMQRLLQPSAPIRRQQELLEEATRSLLRGPQPQG